ncbi:MAG: hypothetical protein PHO92_05280, partial [Candidatus Peribacteraceae bacterium]|nr:hypothetical protein [Candidatus Peribacteraceae bacterium]
MESRETAPERREDLFSLLSEVEGLAGRSIAMLSDEAWAPGEQVSLAEVQVDVRQFENERWLRQEILRFEEIVRRNVRHHFFEQQQVLADGAAYSPEGMSTLEAISLRMTLWKYEEAHLKEYIDALRRYRTHVETYKERAQGLRDDTTIQKYELMSALALGRLKELVPAMQATTRLVWALEYLEADKEKQVLSAQDRAQLEKLIQYLRQRLPEKGAAVHPAIQDIAVRRDSSLAELQVAREVLAGRMREVFVEKVQVDVRKSALSPSVGVPYALYLQFLQLHRRAAFEELRDAQTPTVEQYVEFLDVSRSINEQSLEYHVATLKHNADVQSLLAMRERFGPEAFERLRSNPQKSQEISDFYKRFLLSKETADAPAGENLVKTLKEKELAHYQAGMSAYLEVVSEDISRYGSMVDRLENMLIGARDAEDLLLNMRHGTVEIAYWVPEHTLGLSRFVGLDYTKLIGQYEAMKNHRAVTGFRELESNTESMKTIFSEAQPGLRVARAAVEADMQRLAALQKEHPPEECAPGRAHNGVKYETIRQQYIGTIERMRDHHDEWIALLDALYENMQGNLNYHVNRLAQNRLLNTQNAPNAVVGALVTSLELYYATGNVKYLNRLVPGSRSFARSVNWPIKQGSRLLYRGGRWAAVRARSAVTSKALPTTMAPKPKVVPRAPEVPKAALKGSVGSASRIRGLLGKAGTVLLAAEAGRQIDLTISLRDVPETQAIDDALELMEGHPQINRDVARYHQEVASLRQRKELIAVREATSAVRAKLLQTKGFSRSLMQRRHALLSKAEQLISYANAQNGDLHSFFPIT